MRWVLFLSLGLGIGLAMASPSRLLAQSGTVPGAPQAVLGAPKIIQTQVREENPVPGGEGAIPPPGDTPVPSPETPPALGPTPIMKVGILQNWLYGNTEKPWMNVAGWADFDYTYRSTGSGVTTVAPVMNRFGNEGTVRELGLILSKPLDQKTWSWGFNVIGFAGSDAQFLQPTQGWPNQANQRFGFSFTDLNLTFHMPILTEGGVDVKVGRQTTVTGWAGALSWSRPFTSSDYAWYNMEEGRYTGISSTWHVTKQLDWYNGIEFGWGTFFSMKGNSPEYITKVSYWLDEEAKEKQIWGTINTGATTDNSSANTTAFELGGQRIWNRYFWSVLDFQAIYSRGPVFGGPPPPGYIERAYDILTYNGVHLNKCWDFNTRLEYYYDADGRGYAGGFGIPKTSYYETTLGFNYHPTKWMELRPEIRYDGATNPAFGSDATNLHRNQLTIAADLMIKF
ncbi:MAG TPA: outer membrane beta-barrel protein [Gemmataceae bacterium]|nr:outer membrane beta-barrel protein [Gemmataceae bacterium]